MLDFEEEDRTVPAESGSGRCGNADRKRGSDGHDRSDGGTAEKQGVTGNNYENRNEKTGRLPMPITTLAWKKAKKPGSDRRGDCAEEESPV